MCPPLLSTVFRRRLALLPRLRRMLGFTMLEIMIILIVMAVIASLSIPSLGGFLESAKVDRTVAELRVAMSQSQRSAIRSNRLCSTSIVVQTSDTSENFQSAMGTSCPEMTIPTLPEGISVKSNMATTPMVDVLASNHGWFASVGDFLVARRHSKDPVENNVQVSVDGASASATADEGGTAAAAVSVGDDGSNSTDAGGDDTTDASDDNQQPDEMGDTTFDNPSVLPPIDDPEVLPPVDENNGSAPSPRSLNLGNDNASIAQSVQTARQAFSSSNCQSWNGCSAEKRANMGMIDLSFNRQGGINYELEANGNVVNDPSGKIVAMISNRPNSKMKCVVISRRIGLTRIGYYKGGLTPEEITNDGQCTTLEWDKQ